MSDISLSTIQQLYDETVVRLDALSEFLLAHAEAECFDVERLPRFTRFVNRVDVAQLDNNDSLRRGVANLKPQDAFEGKTVPKRIPGILKISSRHRASVMDDITKINELKKRIRAGMTSLFSDKHERRQAYKSIRDNTIVSTIYRQVNVAPIGTYRVTYGWCRAQIAPNPVDYKMAKALIKSQTFSDELSEDMQTQLLNKDLRNLEAVGENCEHLIRISAVRPHPLQILTSLNEAGKPTRRTIKASSPTIVFVGESKKPLTAGVLKPLHDDESLALDDAKNSITHVNTKGYEELAPHVGLFLRAHS